MRNILQLLLLLIIPGFGYSQNNLGIGEWRSHLPQQSGRLVTQSIDKIIYATEWNLILIDKSDLSVDFMSKVDGLSEVGISFIKYDSINEQLIVVYNNSNIDIITTEGQIINIPNLKSNTSISGDKRVYDIAVSTEGDVYFATGFGIIEFDGKNYSFGGTTITNVRVNSLEIIGDRLLAGMEDGLYSIVLSENLNISDFGEWQILEGNGLPFLQEIIDLSYDGNTFYIGLIDQVLFSSDLVTYSEFDIPYNSSLKLDFINRSDQTIVFGFNDGSFASETYFLVEGSLSKGTNCSTRIQGAIVDELGRIWYADGFPEIRYSETLGSDCRRLTYNSPFHHSVGDMIVKDGTLYVSDGGVSDNFQYLFSRNGFYILEANSWFNFNEFNRSEIAENELLSFYTIAPHPNEDIVYVGSYWGGLLEYDRVSDLMKIYTQENSSLTGAIGDEARERVTGIVIDAKDNLWVSTYGSAQPINVRTPDGEWHSYAIDTRSNIIEMVLDDNGYLWCTIGGANGGVYILDPGERVETSADDRTIYLSNLNSEIPSDRINTITKDLDGQMWIGTNEGPIIFNCGSELWEGNCQGQRRIVLEDSIAAFLLADQDVVSIEVDGANRKWFGTRNGIFVQSSNGESQLLRFTEANSPLFDNYIRDMTYDGMSGLMYIGTDRGIISYKTETTSGALRHIESDVYAYPNPVPPDYLGSIAIKGLVENAEIKITDINGRLIQESQAQGGQAIWNGKDSNGVRVATGVYLVFSSESSSFRNPDSFVTKILLLN